MPPSVGIGAHWCSRMPLGGSVCWVVFQPPYLHATGEGNAVVGLWVELKCPVPHGTLNPIHHPSRFAVCSYLLIVQNIISCISEWQGSENALFYENGVFARSCVADPWTPGPNGNTSKAFYRREPLGACNENPKNTSIRLTAIGRLGSSPPETVDHDTRINNTLSHHQAYWCQPCTSVQRDFLTNGTSASPATSVMVRSTTLLTRPAAPMTPAAGDVAALMASFEWDREYRYSDLKHGTKAPQWVEIRSAARSAPASRAHCTAWGTHSPTRNDFGKCTGTCCRTPSGPVARPP